MQVAKKLEFILKQNEQDKLSHAFLVETNNIDACLIDIKKIIKEINCEQKYNDDCNKCNICNLIDKEILPSIIKIVPDGASIKREQIENLEKTFTMKPIYSKYNIYIIVNAELLNLTSSNLLLKFLEEPNENIIGFLITNDMKQILPTIKSRCEITTCNYEISTGFNEEIVDIANKYLEDISDRDKVLINKDFLSNELDRLKIQEVFNYIYNLYKKEIESNIKKGNNIKKLMKIIDLVEKILKYLQFNVNIELLLDDFVIEMRRINE